MEIQELFAKINEIRRKAEQSEVMVQEICRDIKKLDYAKKHLTYTITALRRLAMLINAVGKLPAIAAFCKATPEVNFKLILSKQASKSLPRNNPLF